MIPLHRGTRAWNSNYYYSQAIPLSGGRICSSGTYWLSWKAKARRNGGPRLAFCGQGTKRIILYYNPALSPCPRYSHSLVVHNQEILGKHPCFCWLMIHIMDLYKLVCLKFWVWARGSLYCVTIPNEIQNICSTHPLWVYTQLCRG